MTNQNELSVIVTEIGVEQETAKTLLESFTPFFEQAKEWQEKAAKLVVTDATQVSEMREAKQARLALKNIRVEADKTRKRLKEDSLRYGKAVQGVYNVIEYLIVPIEQHLEEQEKFAERAEAKRKEELKLSRIAALQPYEVQTDFYDLANMKEVDFDTLLSNSKSGFEQRKEAEAKAEAERIERERKEAEEREAQRLENIRLKAEAEAREKELAAERAKLEAERKAAEAEKKRIQAEAEKKAAEERAKVEAEQKRMREEAQAKIEAERKERERIQAELKAKEEEQARILAEAEAAKEAELAKGDSDKFNDLINDLEALKTKYSFKAKKYQALLVSAVDMISKMITYLKSKQ